MSFSHHDIHNTISQFLSFLSNPPQAQGFPSLAGKIGTVACSVVVSPCLLERKVDRIHEEKVGILSLEKEIVWQKANAGGICV